MLFQVSCNKNSIVIDENASNDELKEQTNIFVSDKEHFNFSNFSYPKTKEWEAIKLKNGKSLTSSNKSNNDGQMQYTIESEIYGVVSDVKCVAVVLNVKTGGSAIVRLVYLFEVSKQEPKLIWSFVSGDRASGGLRNIYFKDSKFIIELYEDEDSLGDCCPMTYRIFFYILENNSIKKINEINKQPNSDKTAIYLGGNK